MEKVTNSKTQKQNQIYVIDATGQILGRLASRIATLLMGKNKTNYAPNILNKDQVFVKNVSLLRFSGKKIKQKNYYRYSGYPGGLKTIPLEKLMKQNPAEVLRKAVSKMLPKNKLRSLMLKRLKIEK